MSDQVETVTETATETPDQTRRRKLRKIGQVLADKGLDVLGGAVAGSRVGTAIKIVGAIAEEIGLKKEETTYENLEVALQQQDPDTFMRLRELQYKFEEAQMNAAVEMEREKTTRETSLEAEVTQRHIADMSGDSTLARNVRPAIAAALTLALIGSVMVFLFRLDGMDPEARQTAIYALGIIGSAATYMARFYFGSRKEEKLRNIEHFYKITTPQDAPNKTPFL